MLSPILPPANPYPLPNNNNNNKIADDTYYMAKYKDMKRKVKEIELVCPFLLFSICSSFNVVSG